jgi:hypothetical protein
VRLLRLPNTIHEKSKLYKIIVSRAELQECGANEIRQLARQPRALSLTDPTGFISRVEVKGNPAAVALFRRVQRQVTQFTRKPFTYRFQRPASLGQIEFPCAGAQAIWQSRIEPGFRNNCAIRLASELRLLGLSAEETERKLGEWNERNGIDLSDEELRSDSPIDTVAGTRFLDNIARCRMMSRAENSSRRERGREVAQKNHPDFTGSSS